MKLAAFSFALATSVVAFSGVASADPYYRHGYRDYWGTIDAQFVYGFWTGDGDWNAFGPGVDVRAGFTLGSGLYLGANFDYFFGETRDLGAFGGSASATRNEYDIMGEIGYDFWVHHHGILRPKIGLGVGIEHAESCAGYAGIGAVCQDGTENGFSFAPGLEYMHFFDGMFLSVEGRFQEVSLKGPDPSAIVLGVGLGAVF
jgi:hypothetical protein